MKQFVRVKYWRRRGVLIDGKPSGGMTNEILLTTEGKHTFSLTPPSNFLPAEQTRTVNHPRWREPLELEFKPKSRKKRR